MSARHEKLQSLHSTFPNMEAPSKTPCFDKGQEEHLRVQPTLSRMSSESVVVEEDDTVGDGTTTPKSPVAPFPVSKDDMEIALNAAVATGSASEESSSDDDDHAADNASKGKKTIGKGGGAPLKAPILKKSGKDGDKHDDENDEDDEEGDEEDDEEGDEEGDEVDKADVKKAAPGIKTTKSMKDDKVTQAVKVVKDLLAVKTSKIPKVTPAKRLAEKKKKAVASEDDEASEKSESGEDDDESDESGDGSDDDEDTTEKKKPVSKKQAVKTTPKNNAIAQMQQKKLAMIATTSKSAAKTTPKTLASKTLASGPSGKAKSTATRIKNDVKSKVDVVPVVAKMFCRLGPSTQAAKKAVNDKKTSSDAGGSKKKRPREEIDNDTATNNSKWVKLERDIELMVLSVKSRSAALERAQKELEIFEMDE